ncbi:MAG: selenide, water dikinase SelD [Candidatus Eremiobacteraeota bacterium]|nr:selenide, water dikinase SelD [Candidatus Eremiobacteraeota bacterium]MBV8721955.1 selenide, water dikinase SelD [Candidatus Eremiobacteraeota bacterium]
MLRELPPISDPRVLVGNVTADDAGVFRLDAERALVQTVDFFTPIVDDPHDYGRIAAANALSDIYAMGAQPLYAVAIAAFPEDLDASVVSAVLCGGAEMCARAGIAVIGGHTIKDAEPKYGLAVTGIVDPAKAIRNDTGEPGDVLVLTKPIGTGILTTARRNDAIDDDDLAPAIESMLELNAAAAAVATHVGVRAMTDVTGFGLIGHLQEMIGVRIGARVDGGLVPLFPKALQLAARDDVPGGTQTNLRNARVAGTQFDGALPRGLAAVLCDAQTSGGLLMAVAPDRAAALLDALVTAGVEHARAIGTLFAGRGISVEWNPPPR